MLNRRQLLTGATASALFPFTLAALATTKARTVGAALSPALTTVFDQIVDGQLRISPESATSFGLDKGKYASAKRLLDDRSLAGRAATKRFTAQCLAALEACDRSKFTPTDTISYETVIDTLRVQAAADKRFDAVANAFYPYALSQLTGAYLEIPDLLDGEHQIHAREDAETYLARLGAFATVLDQEIEAVRHDTAAGVRPPAFVLEKLLVQLRALRGQPAAKSSLVQSLVRRTAEQKIGGDWDARASAVYTKAVQPALDRQIALVESLRSSATADAGAWRLPDGAAYYASALRTWTTSDMPAEEIHKVGLERVAELSHAIDEALKAQSLSTGSVGTRLQALAQDARFRYVNSDEGRAKVMADIKARIAAVKAKLPQYFGTLPKTDLRIERVPVVSEAGRSIAYYSWPSMDGTRPGTFFINLRNPAEISSWSLPTTVFHEALPGHHLQLALQAEANMHLLRKMSFYSAYSEGWGLYAEQLADEMGMYENDPFGRIGYLQAQLYRAARLVLDTGLHLKRWSREQSIRYYMDVVGDHESVATTEVERYCVWPGQACTYMLGKLAWERLREEAKARE